LPPELKGVPTTGSIESWRRIGPHRGKQGTGRRE
jgi:hypothetical protein